MIGIPLVVLRSQHFWIGPRISTFLTNRNKKLHKPYFHSCFLTNISVGVGLHNTVKHIIELNPIVRISSHFTFQTNKQTNKCTYFCKIVSLNKLWQWHNMATNKRWDICNVGLSNTAKVCAFILFIFSFSITECRWVNIHDSSVRFAVGSWLMRLWSSRSCWPTCGNDAASSKRVVRSVVNIGSGSSLQ